MPQPAEHPSRQRYGDREHYGSGHHGRVRLREQLQDGRIAGHRVRLHGVLDGQASRMRTYEHVIFNCRPKTKRPNKIILQFLS